MKDDLAALARHLLGPQVTVVSGRIEDLQEPLWAEEADRMTRAVASRRADFTAGRTASRRAMGQMGLPPAAIPQGLGGAPIWPAGLVGSVTHGGGMCIAALAQSGQARSLGIDLEPLAPLEPALVNEICTAEERDWIATQPDAADLPLRIFTVKEATYKALYPLSGIVFDFAALDVRVDDDSQTFTVRLNINLGPFPKGDVLTGGQGMVPGFILSTLRIDPNTL